ncbi:hypothetical protein KEJ18_04380 [Candidatus Bathyarchaeota archaeon]|nr:hypothetical protein [Candidatus Bathyarchaeota archaeon]
MSVFMLGRDEHAIRDEPNAYYHRGHSRYGYPMWGRLILTNKRFIFIQQEVVERGGILSKKKEVRNVGIKINLPVTSVLGAMTETRERKKGTIDAPPSLFSKEQYNVLIVSLDTPEGQENPSFEVRDLDGWTAAIQKAVGGETV